MGEWVSEWELGLPVCGDGCCGGRRAVVQPSRGEAVPPRLWRRVHMQVSWWVQGMGSRLHYPHPC